MEEENWDAKVSSLRTDVSNLKQKLRADIKDVRERSRIPKVLNNAPKVIENTQYEVLKMYKGSNFVDSHIWSHIIGVQDKLEHCQLQLQPKLKIS